MPNQTINRPPNRGIATEFLDAFPAVLGPRFWPRLRRVVAVIVLLASLRSAVADWSTIGSGSMIPTFLVGDRVLVNKLAYDLKVPFTTLHLASWQNPRRGDVIVFLSPADGLHLVKRVIGVPGDIVEMRDDVLYLNGVAASTKSAELRNSAQDGGQGNQQFTLLMEQIQPSEIPHAIMESGNRFARRSIEPTLVPAGKYFVLGDNRDDSLDSRYFGPVDRSEVLGRTSLVLISMNEHYLPRLRRVFKTLP